MSRLGRFLAVVLLGCVAVPAAAARDALFDVDSRGTSAVAVGDSGRILYSWPAPHNVSWASTLPYVVDRLHAVTTTATGYVAVGSAGRVMRSTDPEGYGTRWVPESSATFLDLYGVTHAGDRLAAVGQDGVVIYKLSQSQGQWLVADPGDVPTDRTLRAVAGNTSYAVAVGDSGTVLWSRSTNLALWELPDLVPTDRNLRGVAPGPGAPPGPFWAVGEDGVILRSTPSARDWEEIDSPTTAHLNDVAFSGFYGVAVGDAGTILFTNGGTIWNVVDSGTTENLYGVGYTGSGAGGGFVAVGEENVILWSQIGNAWIDVIVAVEKTSWGAIRGRWYSAPDER